VTGVEDGQMFALLALAASEADADACLLLAPKAAAELRGLLLDLARWVVDYLAAGYYDADPDLSEREALQLSRVDVLLTHRRRAADDDINPAQRKGKTDGRNRAAPGA